MPNIQGEYTLSELSLKIGVSPSWINKVQKRTGIGGKVGTSGKRVYFTEDDVTIFKNVKLLRVLDFDLKEIKEIYELEKKIIDMAHGYSIPPEDSGSECYMFIIHPWSLETLSNLMHGSISSGSVEEVVESLKIEESRNVDAAKYEKSMRSLFTISKEVTKRVALLGQDLEKFKKKISYNSLDWGKIN